MSAPTPSRALPGATALVCLVAVVLGLVVAPTDAVQGQAQRLMYVHVPAAWTAYLCFGVVLVAGVAYLLRRDLRWDRRARVAAEIGVGCTGLAIVLGALWGRAVWGVWWTWDARLVTTLLLLLVYVGYLGLRGLSGDPDVDARRSAVVGIVAFVNVPLVHFSVVWWRTLHQPPTVLSPDAGLPLDGRMALALGVHLVAFTMLAALVAVRRLRNLRPPEVVPGAAEPPPVVHVVRRSSA
jgi:heme exporter protein C